MAAAATATKLVRGTITSSSPVANKVERPSAERPDLFFGKIRACLKAQQLPKALEILRLGNSSIHRNLVPGNIEKVAAFLSVEKETPEKTASVRCSRLTKIMEQHFPDVFQLEMIKKKGIEAGLTADEVDQSLEQVSLEGGRFWIVKEIHSSKYDEWGFSLVRMAANNQINFWLEKIDRTSEHENRLAVAITKQQCSSRGLFRGLESTQSLHWMLTIPFYFGFFEEQLISLVKFPSNPFLSFSKLKVKLFCQPFIAKFLCEGLCDSKTFFPALGNTSKHSKIAYDLIQMFIKLLPAASAEQFQDAAGQLLTDEPDVIEWTEFLEVYLPNVFSDCTQDVQNALKEFIAAGEKYKEIIGIKMGNKESCVTSTEIHDQAVDESGVYDGYKKFIAAFRPVRDAIFANSFCSEWPNRNKDVISVVMFGVNHTEGFKQEVFARQEGKADSKAENKDEKKKEDSEKADSKLT